MIKMEDVIVEFSIDREVLLASYGKRSLEHKMFGVCYKNSMILPIL